jgi:hypothetical protein
VNYNIISLSLHDTHFFDPRQKKKRWKTKKYSVFHDVQKDKHGTKENTAITSFDDFNGLRTLF